jgi:hypothetical protein
MDRNSHDAKWQENEPDEWVENQGQQSYRPTQHEQNAPEKKSDHESISWLEVRDSGP